MRYLIQVFDPRSDDDELYSGPVGNAEVRYLRTHVIPHLTSLSVSDYVSGPATLLLTAAPYSYVLDDGPTVLWCVEWDPGLLVVQFSPDGTMAWAAMRSPVPDFGGRIPDPEDNLDYDEDDNPQYRLVFDPWDATFEEDTREWKGFEPATDDESTVFLAFCERANAAGGDVEPSTEGEDGIRKRVEAGAEHIKRLAGRGVRFLR